jgi:hypothetical protein
MRLVSTGFRATASVAMLNPLSANRSDSKDLEVALIISGGQLARMARSSPVSPGGMTHTSANSRLVAHDHGHQFRGCDCGGDCVSTQRD